MDFIVEFVTEKSLSPIRPHNRHRWHIHSPQKPPYPPHHHSHPGYHIIKVFGVSAVICLFEGVWALWLNKKLTDEKLRIESPQTPIVGERLVPPLLLGHLA